MLGAIALALSGKPSSGSDLDLQGGYAAALEELRFPPGRPPRGNDPNAEQSDMAMDPNIGAIDAANAWFCAWAIEWRETRRSDPARATAALQELASAFPDGIFWRSLAKADGLGLKAEVDAARHPGSVALEKEIQAFGCES